MDRLENAYRLTLPKDTISNLILFDELQSFTIPWNGALEDFRRVLAIRGTDAASQPLCRSGWKDCLRFIPS